MNIKRFAKTENELKTDKNNKNIRSGYGSGIWKRKMYHVDNEKWKNTNKGKE